MLVKTTTLQLYYTTNNNNILYNITTMEVPSSPPFDRKRHVKYFGSCLRNLPSGYDRLDTNRLTLVHFAVHSLDLLGVLPETSTEQCLSEEEMAKQVVNNQAIVDWIYSLQLKTGGFVGGTFLGPDEHLYSHSHVAMTYTALCTLAALGDDLSRVDKPKAIESLRPLQRPDGAFQCVQVGSEHDMRFLYCACVISHLLNDWSAVDQDKAADFVQSCIGYDGGISLIPGQEGHGGSTFCGVAALTLMNRMDVLDQDLLIHWCVHRQMEGMQGRPNKAEDTCYSYWIGATLCLVGRADLLDQEPLRNFILKCQTQMGGFSKVLGAYPDILHAFYSMSWLSLSSDYMEGEEEDLNLTKLNCTVGICQDRMQVFNCERQVP
jgi:geranylgeranyl transferase type-1 subunit beta